MKIETSAAPEDAATATSLAVCLTHSALSLAVLRILSIDKRTEIGCAGHVLFALSAASAGTGRATCCTNPPDRQKKTTLRVALERTGWDSNPRYAINVHTLSRRAP